jgi:hypothetical protein
MHGREARRAGVNKFTPQDNDAIRRAAVAFKPLLLVSF